MAIYISIKNNRRYIFPDDNGEGGVWDAAIDPDVNPKTPPARRIWLRYSTEEAYESFRAEVIEECGN